MLSGGFPFEPIQRELRAIGGTPQIPTTADPARWEVLRELWTDAGLESISKRIGLVILDRSLPTHVKPRSRVPVDAGAPRACITAR